jgi:hypothetical protein
VAWIFALPLLVVSHELGCTHSGKNSSAEVLGMVGTRVTTPAFLLLMNVDYLVVTVGVPFLITVSAVLALVVVCPLFTAAPIDLLYFALVIVVFVAAGLAAGYLSVLCYFCTLNQLIRGLLAAHNDLLRRGLLDDDGLGRLVADDDGWRWRGCGLLGAEVFCGSRIPLKFVGSFTRCLPLILVFPFHAVLSDGGRKGPLHLPLDAVFADLSAGRRRGALDFALYVAELADLAIPRSFVAFDDILAHLTALLPLLDGLARTVDQAHLGLVAVFLEGPVGDLVALDRGVAASAVRGVGARVPVALALTFALVDDGHVAGWVSKWWRALVWRAAAGLYSKYYLFAGWGDATEKVV